MPAVGDTLLPTTFRRLEGDVLILFSLVDYFVILVCGYEDYLLDLDNSRAYSLATPGLRLVMNFIDRC